MVKSSPGSNPKPRFAPILDSTGCVPRLWTCKGGLTLAQDEQRRVRG